MLLSPGELYDTVPDIHVSHMHKSIGMSKSIEMAASMRDKEPSSPLQAIALDDK